MTKNAKKFAVVLTLALLAGAAFAGVTDPIVELVSTIRPTWFVSGIYVGPLSTTPNSNTDNKVTRILGAFNQSITFAAATAVTCADSTTSITVTGAQVNDPCFLSLPATQMTNGVGSFSCVVTAANTVKIRFCNGSAGSLTPATSSISVRVISSQ
jgi:hypothetical protein